MEKLTFIYSDEDGEEFNIRETERIVVEFDTDGYTYHTVVDKFLLFLSTAYGYPITLDMLKK